jgi:alkylhydroperoxidase family enzyme
MAREPSERAPGLYADLLPKLAGDTPTSPRELAALDFARRLATDHTSMDDAFMAGMRERFSDPELVELGLITAAFVMLGRLHKTFGVAPMGPNSHAVLREG